MEAIITAIVKLGEYYLVSIIKLEDRMLSSLLQTVVILLLQFVFSKQFLEQINKYKTKDQLLDYTEDYHSVTWILNYNIGFDKNILSISVSAAAKYQLTMGLFNFNTMQIDSGHDGKNKIEYLNKIIIPDKKILPIYTLNNHTIGLAVNNNCRVIVCKCLNTLNKFMVEIASKTKSIYDKYNGIYEAKSIYEITSESSYAGMGIISNYHIFDNYISNQIDELKHTIKIFKQLNEARYTNHEIHNNYNLGIILHGEPGTGKTLLIKTIAIELQMGVALVDMRKIKTCKDFQKVINDYYKDFVIVFEEFDFVQGIITNREATECKTIDKLNEDKLRLLSVVTQSENITKELALIDEKISAHENKLTLDSMLTVLDGVREYKGRVIIATTNLIDKIDPALMRCGRFDIKVELKKYNSDEISMYLSKRYKCDISGKFKPITPADLRQLCVKPMDYVINELTI